MTSKERVYWKLTKQLYERYKTINWAFGLIFACATFYYFLISDYGVIHGKYKQETAISSARK